MKLEFNQESDPTINDEMILLEYLDTTKIKSI